MKETAGWKARGQPTTKRIQWKCRYVRTCPSRSRLHFNQSPLLVPENIITKKKSEEDGKEGGGGREHSAFSHK